ncbi:MAG: NAD(P)/FAD-dependent oxidoreductase [Candidatus Omnitrophota bacterium]
MNDRKKILVIGGGPSGMMAAISAAESGASVILLEKNDSLGRKLLLTGKGRCNLTNAVSLEEFLKRFGRNGSFLRDAFKVFFNKDLMKFFEKRGVRLKVERQQRIFPESDRASSILSALNKALKDQGVDVCLNSSVKKIVVREAQTEGVELAGGKVISGDAIIIATGGCSYPWTGSTGDGFEFARRTGHAVTSLLPALCALETAEGFPKALEGLTLKNISLVFKSGKKRIKTEVGELLFTARGVSGPLVISGSGLVAEWLEQGMEVTADIDLKPGLSADEVEARLIREFKESPKKTTGVLLKKFLPLRIIEIFLKVADISYEKRVNQITQIERQRLGALFKRFRFNIVRSSGIKAAMVTRGGISVSEINPRTMQSLRIKGLFFCGEVIDVDGDTGGFNLQAAFSTGFLAGKSAGA